MDRVILKPMDFNKLKDEAKKNKDKEIIFASSDDDLNRKVMEKLDISGVLVYLDDRRDYMKQRDSGLNEIMVRILKKREMNLYFYFDELVDSKNPERILARLKQNIKLCDRLGVSIKVLGGEKKSKENISALFFTLGASTKMIKNLF